MALRPDRATPVHWPVSRHVGSPDGNEPHGWPCSETLATRSGDFEFVNGYPTDDAVRRLRELQLFNRAIEVYLTQLMPVSEMAMRQGLRSFGAN